MDAASTTFKRLSDEQLAEKLEACLADERKCLADILRLIAEVDRRRLYLAHACPSMFDYVTRVLHSSEGAAYKRIQVARAGRRFPDIFERVGKGELHLSGLRLLVPHLTEENHQELFASAKHRSKREIERMIAALRPRSDVPTTLRKLPPSRLNAVSEETASLPVIEELSEVNQIDLGQNTPNQTLPHCPNGSRDPLNHPNIGRLSGDTEKQPCRIEPLSAERYLLKVTVSQRVRDKLTQAQNLMSSDIAPNDTAALLERALDRLIADRLKTKSALGVKRKVKPRFSQARSRTARSRTIPAAVRRVVFARDEGRCTFVDATGRRCSACGHLQYHHDIPFARGGPHTVTNIRLLCSAHNSYRADQDFGADHVRGKIARAQKHSASLW